MYKRNAEKIKNMNYHVKNYKDHCKRTGKGKGNKDAMQKSQLIILHPESENTEKLKINFEFNHSARNKARKASELS